MAKSTDLTLVEQQMLLAIMRLHPNAYGVSIRDEIKTRTGKEYSFGSVYAVLERLEDGGLISSREGEVSAARGGRKKQHFILTGTGQKLLAASLNATWALLDGIEIEGVVA